MPDAQALLVFGATLLALVVLLGLFAVVARMHRAVPPGQALIVNKMGEVSVHFASAVVIPGISQVEIVDLTTRTITVERLGEKAVLLADGSRAGIVVDFFVSVGRMSEDVVRSASALGAGRIADAQAVAAHFTPKFESALEMVCAQSRFETMHRDRAAITRRLREEIGDDLSGFVIEDISLRTFARSSSGEPA